jgi:hypothetical protein
MPVATTRMRALTTRGAKGPRGPARTRALVILRLNLTGLLSWERSEDHEVYQYTSLGGSGERFTSDSDGVWLALIDGNTILISCALLMSSEVSTDGHSNDAAQSGLLAFASDVRPGYELRAAMGRESANDENDDNFG